MADQKGAEVQEGKEGDVAVTAAQVLDEGMTVGADPRQLVGFSPRIGRSRAPSHHP
jgi:hypothetical protein